MRALVAMEGHFESSGGEIFSTHLTYERYFRRYLKVFEEVLVAARVKPVAAAPAGWEKASGAGLEFCPLPEYRGPEEYLRRRFEIKRRIRKAVRDCSVSILTVPGTIGSLVWKELPPEIPRGLEVVADPYDSFSPGAVRHPLRSFFRWWRPRRLRQLCRRADGVAYVTREALQRRYPPGPGVFTTYYSNISSMKEEDYVPSPRDYRNLKRPLELITVGSLAQLYKSQDVLLRALASCRKRGNDLRLILVGDGRRRAELERLARVLGIGDRVVFRGRIPAGRAIRENLDRSDVFILPSRQEGLPRAMVEAMARALPCIGSTVGGIPELLPPEDLVPPGDVEALARKISEVTGDPGRLSRMSRRNLEVSREYRDSVLEERRIAFYRFLKERSGGGRLSGVIPGFHPGFEFRCGK